MFNDLALPDRRIVLMSFWNGKLVLPKSLMSATFLCVALKYTIHNIVIEISRMIFKTSLEMTNKNMIFFLLILEVKSNMMKNYDCFNHKIENARPHLRPTSLHEVQERAAGGEGGGATRGISSVQLHGPHSWT